MSGIEAWDSPDGSRHVWVDGVEIVYSDAELKTMHVFPYVWAWRVRPRPSRQGERCRVLVRGTMNSALVEFEDGYRVVTSRNGLRRVK